MKVYNHLKIHQDHLKWKSDLEMWSLDLKMWEDEIKTLKDSLSFIEEAVKNHEDSLMDHIKSLMDHHEKLDHHEKDITFLIEGSTLDTKLVEYHDLEDIQHEINRNAHERLKRYHHTVVALTNGLKKAFESI